MPVSSGVVSGNERSARWVGALLPYAGQAGAPCPRPLGQDLATEAPARTVPTGKPRDAWREAKRRASRPLRRPVRGGQAPSRGLLLSSSTGNADWPTPSKEWASLHRVDERHRCGTSFVDLDGES